MTATARSNAFEPALIEGVAGAVLAVHHAPPRPGAARGIVYLPPFAEEMNRARRMATLQAQALSAAGDGALILDPYGTGDSAGDFRDARWEVWRDDAARAVAWMNRRGYESITLLGLRLGGLLALDAVRHGSTGVGRVVLWQPVLRGEQMITQFLRLRLAADLAGGRRASETTAAIRKELAEGAVVEVAGYELHRDLVAAIDTLSLAELGLACGVPIDWIEIAPQADQAPTPAHEQVAGRWRAAGIAFRQHRVAGEPFWTLQETSIVPALVSQTGELLRRAA